MMENEKCKIDYDYQQKKLKKIYRIIGILISLTYVALYVNILEDDYYNIAFFLPLILFLPYIPNMLTLKKIKCPKCDKNYFNPFLANKDEVKKLIKSNPKCIHCNYEAEIISDLKNMY